MERNPCLQYKSCTFSLAKLQNATLKSILNKFNHVHSYTVSLVVLCTLTTYIILPLHSFICSYVSITINNFQNLAIQLHQRCNKDLLDTKSKSCPVHHSSSPVHCLYTPLHFSLQINHVNPLWPPRLECFPTLLHVHAKYKHSAHNTYIIIIFWSLPRSSMGCQGIL